jgi:hypothetical protein
MSERVDDDNSPRNSSLFFSFFQRGKSKNFYHGKAQAIGYTVIAIVVIGIVLLETYFNRTVSYDAHSESPSVYTGNAHFAPVKYNSVEESSAKLTSTVAVRHVEGKATAAVVSPLRSSPTGKENVSQEKLKRAPSPKKPISDVIKELYHLGASDAGSLIKKLTELDPLDVDVESPSNFTCPMEKSQRIDFPNVANWDNVHNFRANVPGSIIFYQHLRKAGGTGFCDLAKNNLPKGSIPPYYCMPDNRGSLATPPWVNTSYLLNEMTKRGRRIAANEWDAFYELHSQIPNVVLATTIRHPIDRWYSQYRFEHLEHRDGSAPDAKRNPFRTWYNNNKGWTMGTNYYVKTFIGSEDAHPPSNTGDFYWTYHKFQKQPITWDLFVRSLRNFRRFHVILVTEWLDSSVPLIERVLGWKTPPKQVLPHEVQAVRATKKSLAAKDILPPDDYAAVLKENVFDLLFFTIAKRIYLERLACHAT